MNQPQLPNGLAAQRLVFLALRRGKQVLAVSRYHVTPQHGALYGPVAAGGINLSQNLLCAASVPIGSGNATLDAALNSTFYAAANSAKNSQVLHGLALKIRIALPQRYLCQQSLGLRGSALSDHEEHLGLVLWRTRAVQQFFYQRHGSLRIAVQEGL